MTPRKELYLKIKEKLQSITELELIGLYRGQTLKEIGNYTAVLIKSPRIQYQTMTESRKQGEAEVELILYVKDGFFNQNQISKDQNFGLKEIDLLDKIHEVVEFLSGDNFTPLKLTLEDEGDITEEGIMSYRLVFQTEIYKQINYKYINKKLTLKT